MPEYSESVPQCTSYVWPPTEYGFAMVAQPVGACVADVVDVLVDAVVVDEVAVVQLPKAAWQPAPQYSSEEPQKPNFEQQLPKEEVAQVKPAAPPHSAVEDTSPTVEVQVPKSD